MSRKTLLREIQSRNSHLHVRQAQLVLDNAKSRHVINRYSPYLIVGVGLLAGIATKTLGWRKVYRFAKAGSRLYPFIINKEKSSQD